MQWGVVKGLQGEVKHGLIHINSHSALKIGASLQSLLRRGVPHAETSLLFLLVLKLHPHPILRDSASCLGPYLPTPLSSWSWWPSLCRYLDTITLLSVQQAQTVTPAKPESTVLSLRTLVVELLWESAHESGWSPHFSHRHWPVPLRP